MLIRPFLCDGAQLQHGIPDRGRRPNTLPLSSHADPLVDRAVQVRPRINAIGSEACMQ